MIRPLPAAPVRALGLSVSIALLSGIPSGVSPRPALAASPSIEDPAIVGDAPREVTSDHPGVFRNRIVREGIAIDVVMEPVDASAVDRPLREGDPVHVRFRIRDTRGEPIPNVYPAAWMDRLPAEGDPTGESPKSCQQKVESYVAGSLLSQPELDLNVYYVLTLNEDASISVVDPLFGFGGSKLLEMVFLRSPGEDWELTEDQRRLFVSMPDSDQVAVVDTADWSVERNIDVGPRPRRLRLQPDEHYLWATWEAAPDRPSGVSVIDTAKMQEVARIPTGRGSHELVFRDDDRYAFVTNQGDGTVTVIDVQKLEKVGDVATGEAPVSAAYSAIGRALYVAHPDGHIAVVDGERHEVLSRIEGEPGLERIRFGPNGRVGFAINPSKDLIHILDAATQRIVQNADVEREPYDVAFSDELAYVLHRGSEIVLMIPLQELGVEGRPVPVIDFPGGQNPPGRMTRPSLGEMIVQAPGATAVLVANPGDRSIYFYKEGMAAPMGFFENYGHVPRAVEVVDRSLRETEPGVYETAVKLRSAGEYDLAFFVDSPRVIHCFDFTVAESPEVAALQTQESVAVEVQVPDEEVEVGRPVELTIRVTDLASDRGKEGLKDVRVLTFLAPGVWQQRQLARAAGDGRYRVDFTPPQPGVYYVFVEIASEKIGFNESPSAVLRARTGSPAEVEGREDGAIKAPSNGELESESQWEGGLE
jgi:YVTN family beta-propeller protein